MENNRFAGNVEEFDSLVVEKCRFYHKFDGSVEENEGKVVLLWDSVAKNEGPLKKVGGPMKKIKAPRE